MPIAFKHIKETLNPHHLSFQKLIDRIKSGHSQKAIDDIRAIAVEMSKVEKKSKEWKALKKQKTALKDKLPSMLIAADSVQEVELKRPDGTPYKTSRADESVVSLSGHSMFDRDELKDPVKARDELKSNKYVHSAWISPSGDGINFTVRFPKILDNYSKYYKSFVENHKHLNLDTSCSNVSRVKYESYDENIWVNEDSLVWDKIPIEKTPTPKKQQASSSLSSAKKFVTDWKLVSTALSKISDSHDGEKHAVLNKISYLFGGWISENQIDEFTAVSSLQNEISKKDVADIDAAYRTIDRAIADGKFKPLKMHEQNQVLNMKVGDDKIFKTLDDVKDEVIEFYQNGYQAGSYIGWEASRGKMSLLKGSTSYWYGPPHSGKSQVAHEVYVNLAVQEDWFCVLLTPETGTVAQVYGELISIMAGKSFVGDYKMSEDEMLIHAEFIRDHFIILDPEGTPLTMEGVFLQVKAIERETGKKVDLVSIDPLNILKFDANKTNGREDIALGFALDYMLFDAKKNDRHNALITHVRDQQIQQNENGQRYYPMPSPREISSGQIFYRKGMLMLTVYRPIDIKGEPLLNNEGVPYKRNETIISISKAKPKGVAQIGEFSLFYDFRRNQYYEIIEGQDVYSPKEKVEISSLSTSQPSAMQPNLEFNITTEEPEPPPF